MKNEKMISYYDLLTMIKDKKYPKVYWHNNTRKKVLYIPSFDEVNGELLSYDISNPQLEDENIRFYLSDCMLESDMFDKCIEIYEEDTHKEDIEKEISKLQSEIDLLSNKIENYHNKIHSMRDRNNYMKEQLKKIQSEINK